MYYFITYQYFRGVVYNEVIDISPLRWLINKNEGLSLWRGYRLLFYDEISESVYINMKNAGYKRE